jgi:hypothetical protein
MFQLVLSLHKCADPTAAECTTAEPLQSVADSVADSTTGGAVMTKTS